MPTQDEIAKTVREIFQKTVKIAPERLTPEATLEGDLGLDSLDMIEVVYEVEDHFDVHIPEEKVKDLKSFREIVEGLHAALNAKGDSGGGAS